MQSLSTNHLFNFVFEVLSYPGPRGTREPIDACFSFRSWETWGSWDTRVPRDSGLALTPFGETGKSGQTLTTR